MVPTVTQQLAAMQDTMLRFIMPAIPADQSFAAEQAGLVYASLGWLADVNESQHAYEVEERRDLRTLATGLLALSFSDDDARTRLQALADVPDDDAVPLAVLRQGNVAVKALTARALESVSPDDEQQAVALTTRAARRQVDREQAWNRMTGLAKQAGGSIAEVLEQQRVQA